MGIGPSSNYSGNLVPLSLGIAYEENPTIAYSVVQGERYAKAMLSPVGLDLLVLLAGSEHVPAQLTSVLIKQVNGLQNPATGPPESRVAFEEVVTRLEHLAGAGKATWTAAPRESGRFELVIHDYAGQEDLVAELLQRLGIPKSLARDGHDIVLPLNLAVGRAAKPELNLVTRSVFELVNLAATAVEVPPEDVALGLTDPGPARDSSLRGWLKIHSAPVLPSTPVLVAVRHRGHWFFVLADDAASKLAFQLLQVLVGMRLVEGTPQSVPTLTIPVTR